MLQLKGKIVHEYMADKCRYFFGNDMGIKGILCYFQSSSWTFKLDV